LTRPSIKAKKAVAQAAAFLFGAGIRYVHAVKTWLLLPFLLPSSALAAEGLPFGMLHWKISKAAAIAAFAPLQSPGRATASDPMTDQKSLIVPSYDWKSCNFRIVFYFAEDELDTLFLDAKFGQHGCSEAAMVELAAHYGERSNDTPVLSPEHRVFKTSETKAVYNGLYGGKIFEVTLMRNGGRPLLIAD
jgi:hypothetical protein